LVQLKQLQQQVTKSIQETNQAEGRNLESTTGISTTKASEGVD
jgi:hypothetical protein